MALGSIDITTGLVRTTLSEANNNVFDLDTSTAINKWSRYKPVSGTWPAGSSGKYGLNLPTDWDHLDITSNARLGDFRGYEHTKGLNNTGAGPIVYCEYMDQVDGTSFQPTTSTYNVIPRTYTFRFEKSTVSNSIRILTTDVGLDSYYWGIRLDSPSTAYYKTLSTLNTNTNLTLDLLFTDPGSLSFTNGFGWPADAEVGIWNWYLLLCSTEKTTWTTTAGDLGTILYLPTEPDLTVYSSGHLHLIPYIICGYTSGTYTPIETLPKTGGQFSATGGSLGGTEETHWDYTDVYTNSGVAYTCTRYESDKSTPAAWYNFIHSNAAHDTGVCGSNTNCSNAISGYSTRFYCDDNTGEDRFGSTRFVSGGAEYWVDVYQYGANPTYDVQYEGCTEVPGYISVTGFVYGTIDITVTFRVNGMPSSPHDVWVRLWNATQGYFYDLELSGGNQVTDNVSKTCHLITENTDILRGRAYTIYITTTDPDI